MRTLSQRGRAKQMNDIVVAACRLAGADDRVRRVHIVAPARPTYGELLDYREAAQTSHVRLIVSGEDFITVRPEQRQIAIATTIHPEERGISLGAAVRDLVTRFVVPRDDPSAATHQTYFMRR